MRAEEVRQPTCCHAARIAGTEIRVDALWMREQHAPVVVVAHAEEDAGLRAVQRAGRDARVLEGVPGHFQQQALLRVHRRGLARRDAEELGIEAVHLVDEAAVAREHLARRVGVLVVEGVDVPAIARNLGDGVSPRAQQFPQAGQVAHAAGKAQCGADDGHRFARGGFGRGKAGTQVADFEQRALDRRQLVTVARCGGHGASLVAASPISASSMASASASDSTANSVFAFALAIVAAEAVARAESSMSKPIVRAR